MNRIEKLTAEQISRFPEFIDRWTRIGLCTDPANRPAAEEGVRLAYEIAGLSPPKKIVWCGSPLSQGLTRAIVFGLRDAEVKCGKEVRASVSASVWDSVWDSVSDSVRDSVWDSVRDSVSASVFGQHEADWLSFYDYFKQAAGLDEQTQRLAGLWKVAQSAGWWLPHQNICWISERHNVLHRNDRGQLHCEDGPALAYPDGFCIWSINGVRVDEQIVMRPETQCASHISGEQNAEVKRVRIERFGWTRYLREVKARVIEHVTNAVSNTDESLMDCDGMRVLVCSCPSTARVYSLEVPGDCPSVEQAQNYLSGGRSRRIIVAT